MIHILSVTKTCDACPAQWEGKTVNHEKVYVRYRWGRLRVEINDRIVFSEFIGEDQDDEEEEAMLRKSGMSEDLIEKMISSTKTMRQYNPGQPVCFDGSLTYEELCEATKNHFMWPTSETN